MITKYKTGYRSIERVQVDRETETSVWYAGSRRAKAGTYFDTWTEAYAHMLALAEGLVYGARHALIRAQSHLGNIKGMKEPKP